MERGRAGLVLVRPAHADMQAPSLSPPPLLTPSRHHLEDPTVCRARAGILLAPKCQHRRASMPPPIHPLTHPSSCFVPMERAAQLLGPDLRAPRQHFFFRAFFGSQRDAKRADMNPGEISGLHFNFRLKVRGDGRVGGSKPLTRPPLSTTV